MSRKRSKTHQLVCLAAFSTFALSLGAIGGIRGAVLNVRQVSVNASESTISATREWSWSAQSVDGEFRQPRNSPVVMDINVDGVPEVLFVAGSITSTSEVGVLRALNGSNGSLHWEAREHVLDSTTPALGDIDGDGLVEIVCASEDGQHVLAFDAQGTLLWTSDELQQSLSGSPLSIADVDADGKAEIVAGLSIVNGDGSMRWSTFHATRIVPIPVDLDGDESLEIVVGSEAFLANGDIAWRNRDVRGLASTAFGNFDEDSEPEVVASVVVGASVLLIDNDGSTVWGPVALEDDVAFQGGGAPVVGDMNGDGLADIGVPSSRWFTVLDRGGGLLWRRASSNVGTAVGAASLFDFNLDGAYEVIYQDEAGIYILDGATGAVHWEERSSSSYQTELPIVADVDGDGFVEIVKVTNSQSPTGTQAIDVYGSAAETWPPALKIWNQHAYHVDNVQEDGRIPRKVAPSWLSHNTFRANIARAVEPPTVTATPSVTPSPEQPELTATHTSSPTQEPTSTNSPTDVPSSEPAPTGTIVPTPTEVAATREVPTSTMSPPATPTSLPPTPPAETATKIAIEPKRMLFLPLLLTEDCPPVDVFSDVVIVLDASTSMLEVTSSGDRKLDIALRASTRLFDTMRLGTNMDRIALVAFNEQAQLLQPLTGNRVALATALGEVRVAQQSRIDLGVARATNELVRRALPGRTQAVIVLTDGRVNPVGPDRVRQASADARRLGAEVFAVGMGDGVDLETLLAIAANSAMIRRSDEPRLVETIFYELAKSIPCRESYYWPQRR